jgi:glycosyltransferase involved in cell wall biosynthesis
MSATVGIALPYLNAAKTLRNSVRSIQQQTFTDWVLYLCDDGSTDGSLDIARDLAAEDGRIQLFSDGVRRGIAATLNHCIEDCTEHYLARMDADDVAYPSRLEQQVAFLRQNPNVDLVGAQMLVFGPDGTAFGKRCVPSTHDDIVRWPCIQFPMAHPTFCGKTDWFRKFGYRPEAVRCEDQDLLFRSYRISRFANIGNILLGYYAPKVDMKKRWLSRKTWLRRLHGYGVSGNLMALTLSVKVCLTLRDAACTLPGTERLLLRGKHPALTDRERSEWTRVWKQVNQTA